MNARIEQLEFGLTHLQRLFDQLNEVVTSQSLQNQRMQRRIDQLTEQIKQLKEKPEASLDPLDEQPPHY
jgi:uncharacterized coiled-coil protein SlyX